MNARILITGKNSMTVDDMRKKLLSSSISIRKCSTNKTELVNLLDTFKPHLMIIVLSKESGESVSVFSALEDDSVYKKLPIAIVGSRDDCNIFNSLVMHFDVTTFARPIDENKFAMTIDRAEYAADAEERKNRAEEEAERKIVEQKTATDSENEPSSPSGNHAIMSALENMTGENAELLRALMADFGASKDGKRKHVLVVDDDPMMLNLIKSYIEDIYDVAIVTGGQQAIKFLQKKHTDLVLLDYVMPDEIGPNVLRRIREQFSGEQLPVIFLTGVSDKDLVFAGMKQNPQDYILKPVSKELLRERIAKVFNK